MSINPFYYKNIVVQSSGIDVSDLSNDFILLNNYDLSNSGNEPTYKDVFDISKISFDINTKNKNSFNFNSRDISNINNVDIPGIYLNKLKFDFNKNVKLSNMRIYDKYENLLFFFVIDNEDLSGEFDTSHNITYDDIKNYELLLDFSNNISIPYKLEYERVKDDEIFKIDSLNLQNNILQEKHSNNVFWSLAPWKTITLSNETIADQEITIDDFNTYLKNVVNQQGRPLFPSDSSAIEIYPYENSDLSCVINFRYQGYTESELADNNDLSFIDISTAVINIGDTSYNYNLSKEVYLDLSSNLFEYLNINQYTNIYNDKKVIELPIDTDVSINFIFKQSKTNKTFAYYGTSLDESTFVFFLSLDNFSDRVPNKDHKGDLIAYDPLTNDISASLRISPDSINIINIHNKPVIFDRETNINFDIDKVNSHICDVSNIYNINNLVVDNLDISAIDSSSINISDISGFYLFDASINIYSKNSRHILVDCSNSIFSSNNVYVQDVCCQEINILKNLTFDTSSNINCSIDTSYSYILSYNNKNLINYDNCANMVNFGISSEGIYNNVNIEITKNLHFDNDDPGGFTNDNPGGFTYIDTSYDIVNPYSAKITNVLVNNIYITSDDRLKFNERDISNGVNVINSLKPKLYNKDDGSLDSGYIAQEVNDINDISYVVNNINDTNYVNYNAIQPYIVNCIQQFNKILLDQASTIEQLRNELNSLMPEPEPEPEIN